MAGHGASGALPQVGRDSVQEVSDAMTVAALDTTAATRLQTGVGDKNPGENCSGLGHRKRRQ